jgi:glycolate oxidase
MKFAPPDPDILSRRDAIIASLKSIVPDGVVEAPSDLSAYESDALPA